MNQVEALSIHVLGGGDSPSHETAENLIDNDIRNAFILIVDLPFCLTADILVAVAFFSSKAWEIFF